MSRTKKDAGEALKELGHYLRRDPGAMKKIDAISRYVGELRQNLSTMKAELETCRKQVQCLRNESDNAAATLVLSEEKLHIEQALHRQARQDADSARRDAERLKDELTARAEDIDPEMLEDSAEFIAIFNKLRRRLKRAPVPVAVAGITKNVLDAHGDAIQEEAKKAIESRLKNACPTAAYERLVAKEVERMLETIGPTNKHIMVCRMSDVLKKYTPDQFETLGMFVALTSLAAMPVMVWADVPFRPGEMRGFNPDDPRHQRLWYWMRKWIKPPDSEEEYTRMELEHKAGMVHPIRRFRR